MEREAWWATDYELAKSQIQLSDHYTHTHTITAVTFNHLCCIMYPNQDSNYPNSFVIF